MTDLREFWGWNSDLERFGGEPAKTCVAISMKEGIFFNTELLHWSEARDFAEWILANVSQRPTPVPIPSDGELLRKRI